MNDHNIITVKLLTIRAITLNQLNQEIIDFLSIDYRKPPSQNVSYSLPKSFFTHTYYSYCHGCSTSANPILRLSEYQHPRITVPRHMLLTFPKTATPLIKYDTLMHNLKLHLVVLDDHLPSINKNMEGFHPFKLII